LNIDDSRGPSLPSQKSGTTTNMQILHAHPPQVTLFIIKEPHLLSNHTNSKPSVQQCNNTLQTTTDHQIDLIFDKTIRLLLNQDKAIIMIADLEHSKLFNNKNCRIRPPFRSISSNNTRQQRPSNITMLQDESLSTSNTINIVCNNCKRLGHFAYLCIQTNNC
jgi:hypothetical protein